MGLWRRVLPIHFQASALTIRLAILIETIFRIKTYQVQKGSHVNIKSTYQNPKYQLVLF